MNHLHHNNDPTCEMPVKCPPEPLGNRMMLLAIIGYQNQAMLSESAPELFSESKPIETRTWFGRLRIRENRTFQTQARPSPEVLPIVLLFPEGLLYPVLSGLESVLAVRRASFRQEGSNGTLCTKDGPLQILRLDQFAILSAVTLDDPSRIPIDATSEGIVEPIREPITGAIEVEEPHLWDFTWEGDQLSVMNYCVTEARRLLGEACYWAPVFPDRSDTGS